MSIGRTLEVIPVEGIAEIGEGDAIGGLIAVAADPRAGDVLVVAQKAVSKAEGQVRHLDAVEPGERARELAATLDKEPALVQVILDQSRALLRAEHGVLICETRSGWICANAGVDTSNVPGERVVTLLPEDADASARRIRREVETACGALPAIVVADSFGRPWRLGQADVAIGCAGLAPLLDRRGAHDREGRELTATVVALADQLAAAADLCRDKEAGIPAALIRGLAHLVTADDGPGATSIQRPVDEDLFR